MKKKLIYSLLIGAMFMLAACGKEQDEAANPNALPKGNKVETEYGKVTLCDYSTLAAEETVYEISEEDVEEEVNNLLYDYIQYVDKEVAEEGNYVEVYMTGTVDGELLIDYSEEEGDPYDILVGYNEYGEEFDSQLIGVTAGAELSFAITYPEDYADDELAGMTVDYSVKVESVLEEIMPEMTEEFVKDTLGYDSEDEMRASIREELDSYYNSDTAYYAKEDLLQQIVESSKFSDYSDDLYASAKEEVESTYAGYMEWIGASTVDEVYAAFEMSEEDVENEILSQVNRTIAIYAIAKEQSLDLTDAEYNEGVSRYAQLYTDYYAQEYTTDQLLAEFGEETLRYWILEDKVLDYLYDHATITQVVGSLDESDSAEAVSEDLIEDDEENVEEQ